MTDQQRAELAALAAMSDDEIDTSDIPEVTDWSNAKRGRDLPDDQAADYAGPGRRRNRMVQVQCQNRY